MTGHLNYEALRHFADSRGPQFVPLVFLALVGWTFRKGASRHHDKAANMIFEEDDHG